MDIPTQAPEQPPTPEPEPRRAGPAPGAAVGMITREAQEHRSAFDSRHMVLIDTMINWHIAHPGKPYSAMAAALGMNAITLRQLASTDAYKARFREMAPELLHAVGAASLRDRIEAAASLALDRMTEQLVVNNDLGQLTDATEVLLQGIYGKGGAQAPGDGAPTPATVQVNVAIAAGRELMLRSPSPPPPLEPAT